MTVRTICNLAEDIPFRRILEGDTIITTLNEVSGGTSFNRDMTGTEVYHEFMKLGAAIQADANQRVQAALPDIQALINEVFRIREQGEQTPSSVRDARTTTGLTIMATIIMLVTAVISWHYVYHLHNKTDLPTGMVWGVYTAALSFLANHAPPEDVP